MSEMQSTETQDITLDMAHRLVLANDVIFCRTRHNYASYVDFFRLAELSGYPIIYIDQIPAVGVSDKVFIVSPLNDEWMNGIETDGRIIHWELEWRWDWRAEVDEPPGITEVWASDKWFAESISARYVPMGSDERLNVLHDSTPPVEKSYDVAQISYQVARRQVITNRLLSEGLKLAPNENLWGEARSRALMQSKVMVHVHQHENAPGVAPLRWCLAAAHKLPIITETVPDRGIFGFSYMMQSSSDFLPRFVSLCIRDHHNRLNDYALALHNLLCRDLTFRKNVEKAL